MNHKDEKPSASQTESKWRGQWANQHQGSVDALLLLLKWPPDKTSTRLSGDLPITTDQAFHKSLSTQDPITLPGHQWDNTRHHPWASASWSLWYGHPPGLEDTQPHVYQKQHWTSNLQVPTCTTWKIVSLNSQQKLVVMRGKHLTDIPWRSSSKMGLRPWLRPGTA